MKIYKSITVPIYTTEANIQYFYECNRESARVWNECIKLDRELWKNEQKYIDRKYLQDHLKGAFSPTLPAKCIQVVCYRYLGAVLGTQRARKQGRNDMKYPWKQKKYYNTRYTG